MYYIIQQLVQNGAQAALYAYIFVKYEAFRSSGGDCSNWVLLTRQSCECHGAIPSVSPDWFCGLVSSSFIEQGQYAWPIPRLAPCSVYSESRTQQYVTRVWRAGHIDIADFHERSWKWDKIERTYMIIYGVWILETSISRVQCLCFQARGLIESVCIGFATAL